jgi:hypothetical protein
MKGQAQFVTTPWPGSAYPENPSKREGGKPAEINATQQVNFILRLGAMEGIMSKRAAIYVRVSTDKQTVENQVRELHQIAERRGWEVVEQYSDAGR